MTISRQREKWIIKKARAGFRGYPIGTVAFYGPDNRRASKVVVGVFAGPNSDPVDLRKWFANRGTCARFTRPTVRLSPFCVSVACTRCR